LELSDHLPGLPEAKKSAELGTMDVAMTYPPFRSEIPIAAPSIAEAYRALRSDNRERGA
jgi:type I restriction enzyme M protein